MKGRISLNISDRNLATCRDRKTSVNTKKIDDPLKDKVEITSSTVEDSFLSDLSKFRDKLALQEKKVALDTGFKKGFVKDFVDGKQVDEKVMELANKYPQLVSVVTRDYKTSGYDGKMKNLQGPAPLRYMKIGKKDEDKHDKTGILLLASPHGREVTNPLILLETVEQLLANYNPDSDDSHVKEITQLIDNLDIYAVPVTNPDGLSYAIHDDPMWRKNRTPVEGTEYHGVDINRNYDYQWQKGDPSKNSYGGSAPFSEPETRHVASIVDEHPNIKFVCDFHSRGNEIRRPADIKDEHDLEYFKYVQQRMHDAIKGTRGKDYAMVISDVSNGSSDDYFYFKKGGIVSLVVEDGTEYKPSLPEALSIVDECTDGAKELLRVAKEYGEKNKV